MPEQPIHTDRLAKIFKALGHPTRIKIIEHLIEIDSCVCGEIVDIFPFSQSTISQHLKQLKDAGIIMGKIEGLNACYCVNKNVFNEFKDYVSSLNHEAQDDEIG